MDRKGVDDVSTKQQPATIVRFTVEEQTYSLPLYDRVGLGLAPTEVGQVKRLCGQNVMGATLLQGVADLDSQILAALLVITVQREGGKIDVEKLFSGETEFEVDLEKVESPTVAPTASPSEATTPASSTTPDGTGNPIS